MRIKQNKLLITSFSLLLVSFILLIVNFALLIKKNKLFIVNFSLLKKNKLLIVGLALLIVGLALLITQIKRHKELQKYNITLVGAGVSNAYLSYLLKQKYPKLNILVIEKTNRIGGRLLSMDSDGKSSTDEFVKDELGGMRMFECQTMKELINLVEELGLTLQPVSLDDTNNYFYYKGQNYLKSEFKLPNGDSISKFKADTFTKFKVDYEERNKKIFTSQDAYNDDFLRNHSLNEYYKRYNPETTDEILKIIESYSGYDICDDNCQASIDLGQVFSVDGDIFGERRQLYVKEGYSQIPLKLFEKANVEFILNTEVRKITKEGDYKIVHLIDSKGIRKSIKSKFISLSGTPGEIQSITSNKIISRDRFNLCSNTIPGSLFKLFLQFPKKDKWWGKNKQFQHGKTTTDLDIRQLHYYDNEDVLIYNCGIYAKKLNNLFATNLSLKAATDKVMSDIRKIHGRDIPNPDVAFTLYKYWPEGYQMWRIGVDIIQSAEEILNGIKDKSNIFIVGDTFSTYQGWVIGAIQTAKNAFELLDKEFKKK